MHVNPSDQSRNESSIQPNIIDGTKSFIDVDKATLLADSVDREDSFLANLIFFLDPTSQHFNAERLKIRSFKIEISSNSLIEGVPDKDPSPSVYEPVETDVDRIPRRIWGILNMNQLLGNETWERSLPPRHYIIIPAVDEEVNGTSGPMHGWARTPIPIQ